MSKAIKAKCELGVNSIMDPIMMPDGYARVCDGVDLRSGVARAWPLPALSKVVSDTNIVDIWEYRGLWHLADKQRTYHGEFLNGQEVVYYTEEGADHSVPQKIVDGKQVTLGLQRPVSKPMVTAYDARYPTSLVATNTGTGGVPAGTSSYRVAATINGTILVACSPTKITLDPDPATVKLEWRKVIGANGYAVFGRTSGSEKLLIKLGDVDEWTDDGTASEGTATASSYDVGQAYQYVYTYWRKIGTIEDESGPSPISVPSDALTTPVITRLPNYDGYYFDAKTYDLAANNLTASITAGSSKTIDYGIVNDAYTATFLTASVAHGMATGETGRLSGVAETFTGTDLTVSVPSALTAPVVSLTMVEPTGGTIAAGTYDYGFTAVRGAVDYYGGSNPAQTTATHVSVTVDSGATNSVKFTIEGFATGTHSIIVYRNGFPIAFIYPTTIGTHTGVASWTDTNASWHFVLTGGCTIPAVNETSTRCFTVPVVATVADGVPATFQANRCDIYIDPASDFAPVVGDVIYLSGLTNITELTGACKVIADLTGGVYTVMKYLSAAVSGQSSTTGKLRWKANNGYVQGWRIYRVGDTSQFLRVADLALNVESYVDLVSTDSLGVAIPTAYDSNGLYVVYDKAPIGLKRMVNHYGMRFGVVDNLVRWTPGGVPDAWPDVYYIAFPSRPVALQSFKTLLSVLCEDGLYGIAGNTASTLSVVGPMSNLGCIAPFTAISSNYGLLWLSKVGVMISSDGMSANCLTSDRVPGRYFFTPSTYAVVDGVEQWKSWYLPPTQSVQFAESMREEVINRTMYPVSQVTNDLPINAEILGIKAFFWDNRYCIFYPDGDNYARSGIITIDMSHQGLPMTTMPIRPVDVHVTAGGDLYMLLQPEGSAP